MIAIKDMAEMPKGCWYSTDLKLSGITTCPLKDYCSRKHIKEAPLDKRPKDCPLVEIEVENCAHRICKNCSNHGINKEHTDIDGARYCSSFHTYTGYDFYCKDYEKRGNENG